MAKELSSQEKIAQITAIKGQPGSADLMRQYYKDLTPIGIQPGGAGMVVNLYSKKENTTLSLCTVYDVVVAVKKGELNNLTLLLKTDTDSIFHLAQTP
jgi:hypothetical protein